MGGNPILQELSQINKRADAIRVADKVVGDATVIADTPGIIVGVAVTPDAPRPEVGTCFNFF